MQQHISYIKLMFAIAGGIVIGGITLWLCSMLLTIGLFSAIASGLNFTLNEPPKSAVSSGPRYQQQVAKERRAEQQAQHQSLRDKREQSPVGRKLFVRCDVWLRNYQKTPTRTTREWHEFYCDQYARYLRTGIVPTGRPP